MLCAVFCHLAGGSGRAEAAEVGVFRADSPEERSVSLDGEWRFNLDRETKKGSGEAKNGWEGADFDDSGWGRIRVGASWESQGHNYDGIAWYRARVMIPSEWKGQALVLMLGRPDDGGETYWNGVSLGATEKFGDVIQYVLNPEQVNFGEMNTIAVRVWDWYKGGGLSEGTFAIERVAPFAPAKTAAVAQRLKLGLTENLPADVLSAKSWRYGWRDEGTADTRPRLARGEEDFQGGGVLVMDVWYPNSGEFVDYRLSEGENGAVWRRNNCEYLSFWVNSDAAGDMKIRLNRGDIRWKQGGPTYEARFWVEPGQWQRVVIPFTAFVQKNEPLYDTSIIDTISLGYGNNHLRAAGKVRFANFEVGRFEIGVEGQAVALDGLWRFTLDNKRPDGTASDFKAVERDREGYGLELGYNKPDFDDSGWSVIRTGSNWESQGFAGYDGPAWYRQKVFIPEVWRGRPLTLRLGKPDDRGSIFWNGELVSTVEKFGPNFEVALAPEKIKYGEYNSIATTVIDWHHNGGMIGNPFSIGPETERVFLRWQGEGEDAERSPEDFEMGGKPVAGRKAEMVVRLLGGLSSAEGLQLDYRLVDCFHAIIKTGTVPAKRTAGGDLEAIITLDEAETRQLFYGEWFDAYGMLKTGADEPVTTFARYNLKLKYEGRDKLALPALPETYEDTPIGRLKLIDVVDAAADSDANPHPYKQGGIRDFWGGRRAYTPGVEGIVVNEFDGQHYREANNNQHFGYRIGRGELKPYKQYLLRIRYPEDKSRYFAMDIKAGRNYQGVGFRTGVDPALNPDDPVTPYPLSGKYEWSDHIVSLDDITYGYRGSRSALSKYGFWVFFHDIGRVYSSQYDSGPAIAEMRLYEIENPQAHYPQIRYPQGAKRRVLMMDWERQPEANPDDVSDYARLIGLNALGPLFLKWSFNGYFPNSQEYDGAPEWYGTPVHRAGFGNENCWRIFGMWLEATRKHDLTFIPRLEYGGSKKLPKEARVIGPDGKEDPCGRYTPWGANLLHPATWEDIKVLLDETIGKNIAEYPNIGGVLWRMRSDRVKCSYGKQDVELFCKETGNKMPSGDAAAIAKWASKTKSKEYHEWWQQKRRDFHVKIRDLLRSYRSDLKLYYYNWDPDGWSLATDNNSANSAQDWSDLYNVNKAREWYLRKIKEQQKLTEQDYLQRLRGGHRMTDEPHKQVRPELYRDIDGIALFLPVHWHYLSNNEPYIRSFETGDGLAVCNQYHYEEKGRTNIQGDNYETSEMTPAGPAFSMAEEVLSMFHGDPNVITWTPYTIGRSFITEHRRFAQAFLALPDMRGKVLSDALTEQNEDVKVRLYETENGDYAGIVHRGWKAAQLEVRLPAKEGTVVTDLVSGQIVPANFKDGVLSFTIEAEPMSLNSYLLK